ALAEVDEAVLARYVESEPMSPDWLRSRLAQHARSGRLFPIMGGSALHNVGVRALLDAVVSDLPPPKINAGDTLSALVFKVQREPQMGRMAFVRLYGGRIESRQSLANATRGGEEKVTQVRKIHAASHADVGAVAAGDIAALCGLSQAKIGDVLGDPAGVPGDPRMPEPILQVKVQPAGGDDHTRLAEALLELEDEDPALKVAWNADIRELTVRVMGAVQVEILAALLASRFDLTARFDQPTVIFKETPAGSGHGFVSYTSIPHWAVMRFAIEPGERGSGVHYTCAVSPRDIKYRYQREVDRRVPFALQQGPKGWEVTDVRVTLVEGSDHERHTHPLDFVAATVWGIEDGLQNTGTKLLEPILAFHLSAPAEFGGRIASELIALRAVFDAPEYRGEFVELRGEVPAATTLEYPLALRRLTGGRATLDWRLARYDLAPEAYNDDPAYTQPKRPWVSFKGFM
ncbi:MAG TPA: EF-Tu/IF-2/RF-3 family GTPase, partial [Limnochordia bacterium]|nr:EF-Tu/IF-2/RF-3 family GTPase [Limnochordia bacterium]